MTALSIEQGINSLADLPGKRVGVFTGSVSEDYVTELRIASSSHADIDQAVAAMKTGQIDAIVGDAPILELRDYSTRRQRDSRWQDFPS